MLPRSADQVSAVDPRNLPGNGETEPQSQRALMREAAAASRDLGLNLSPVEIRLVVSGYQSSAERDTRSLSQWLQMRCSDPTGETAIKRADLVDPRGEMHQRRAAFRAGGGR